jgi:fatty-acyl-CoA synthase
MRGYIPGEPGFSRKPFKTGDIGHLDTDGHLHVDGRADRVIITGGENVHPEQVELAALSSGLVSGARCRAVPDIDWGHRIELDVVFAKKEASINDLRKRLSQTLPAYAVPKKIHSVGELRMPKTFDA